jgi:lysosomal alpha-mannosidase
MLPNGNEPAPEFKFCLQLNISQCDVSETSDRFVVNAYNPKAQLVSKFIRVPVTDGSFTVVDPSGG